LTRNLVTEANIDPDGNKLEVPDVTHLQISCDGKWLATIEDWLPPARNVEFLATSKAQVEVERRKRRETYLKIWRWDEATKQWSLNTRFAQPHADAVDEQANRTFDLVASPTANRFATVGEDSTMRSWRPRTRGGVTTWDVEHVLPLGKNTIIAEEGMDFTLPASPTTGRLAYSNDGSVLAVCLQDDGMHSNSMVHFLNTRTGRTRGSENGLTLGKLVGLGFLDRYLILLSDELRVWDTVIGTMVFSQPIGQAGANMNFNHRVATHHLAISPRTETFAVAGVGITDEHSGSSVLIYKPTDVTPVLAFKQHAGAISALTALSDGTGFLALDSQAEIRTLSTHVVALAERLSKSVGKSNAKDGDLLIETMDTEDAAVTETGAEKKTQRLAIEDESKVVKSNELGKVFAEGGAGVGGMGVRDMFDGVARLFASKSG
jgi:NET1-associated nuclear protein 1 (U3 small nucleolar RNA-associated protein 17)